LLETLLEACWTLLDCGFLNGGFYAGFCVGFYVGFYRFLCHVSGNCSALCFWSVKHKLNVPRDEFWDPILEAVGLSNVSDPKTKAKSDQ
jgi:hypothetical protein